MIADIGCLDEWLSKLKAILFKDKQLAGWTYLITLVARNGSFQIDEDNGRIASWTAGVIGTIGQNTIVKCNLLKYL